MSFAVKVQNMRKGPFKSAQAFFDVAIGYEENGEFVGIFVVTGFALKNKRDGGYFYQAPGKPRTDKSGQQVKNDAGYTIYDPYFDLFRDGKEFTKAAWRGKDLILNQAVAVFESGTQNNAGRGASTTTAPATTTTTEARGKTTTTKAAAKATPTPAAVETAFPEALDEEDDDLPF